LPGPFIRSKRDLFQKTKAQKGDIMRELIRRITYLLTSHRRRRELEAEMSFHREMAARSGRLDARRSFGNPTRIHEQAREAWGWTWIDRITQDLSYAARTLRRSPAFTVTAILVLAVGIGVNVTAFSLFNMMVLQYMPIRDPQSIVRLERRSPDATANSISYASILFYGSHAKSLSAVMGLMGAGGIHVDQDLEPTATSFVTENYFRELGTRPALGRLFDPVIDTSASDPVVVLGYPYWQHHFGGDPNVIGKAIRINQQPATIIGVTPEILATPGHAHPDLWLPMKKVPYFVPGSTALVDTGSSGSVEMWARLAPGVSAKAAEQELLTLTNERRKQFPKDLWKDEFIHSEPGGHDQLMQPEMTVAMSAIGGLVFLILAVACANLGGLMLARGVSREHEISIRVAIGAGRGRIFRQLFTESLLLSALGSAAGLILGYIVLRITMANANAPTWMTATPDWKVVTFTFVVGFVAAALFGLAPALQISRQRQRRTIIRQVLLAAQIAASCLLLIVAGLLVRAAQHALYANPGFQYEQVLAVDLGLGSHGYKPAEARSFLEEFRTRVHAIPGVTSVAVSSMQPLGHIRMSTISNTIHGHLVRIFPFTVDPDFFSTMQVPLLRGRLFLPGEKHAVIVSDSLARKQWPGEDPIGKQDASGSSEGDVVVGVVANARLMDMQDGDTVELYHPAREEDMADLTVLIKTQGAPDGLAPTLHSIVQNLDPKLFPDVRTLKSEFKYDTQSAGNIARIISLLGMVAVLLSSLGILGLAAYTVSQRTKEIAIRLALGASKVQLLVAVLRQFSWPVAIGLLVGAGSTAAVSRLLRRILYGVSNLDPISYATAILLLVAIVTVAALLPAKRALNLDVARALHQE
jgi:predicted permease